MPPKLTDSETMAFRIPLRVIREFRILSDKTERAIAWHVRRALSQYLEREKASAPAASAAAPDPVVTALTKTEWFRDLVAEMKAELDRPAPAEVAAELKAKPELKTKPERKYRILPGPRGRSRPEKSVEPAVAVPPMLISKHAKH
jgi:hypothetical protein